MGRPITRGALIRVAGALGLSVLLGGAAGCGAAVVPPDAAPSRDAVERVHRVLDGLRDLPDGLSDRPRDPWRAPFRAADSRCRLMLGAVGSPPREGMAATAGASFTGDGLAETAGVRVTEYDGEARALRHFAAIAAAMGGCTEAVGRGAGVRDRLAVSPLSLDTPGRLEAVALRGRVGGYPYRLHLVVARSGRTLITLAHGGIAAPGRERTERIVRLLLDRTEARMTASGPVAPGGAARPFGWRVSGRPDAARTRTPAAL